MLKEKLRKWLPIKFFYFLMHAKNYFYPTESYLITKDYSKKLKAFYGAFIQKGDLVFDVGANFGSRVKTFLSLGARVVAIEPQPECINFLKSMYASQITLVQKGLAAKEGFLDFYMSKDTTVSSFSKDWVDNIAKNRFKESKYERSVKVPVTTLDCLIQQYGVPAFIKIDVEGFEFEVLRGLTHKVRYLSFEYVVPEKKETIINCIFHLKTLGGILINYSKGESMQLGLEKWVTSETFIGYLATEEFENESAGDIYVQYVNLA